MRCTFLILVLDENFSKDFTFSTYFFLVVFDTDGIAIAEIHPRAFWDGAFQSGSYLSLSILAF